MQLLCTDNAINVMPFWTNAFSNYNCQILEKVITVV